MRLNASEHSCTRHMHNAGIVKPCLHKIQHLKRKKPLELKWSKPKEVQISVRLSWSSRSLASLCSHGSKQHFSLLWNGTPWKETDGTKAAKGCRVGLNTNHHSTECTERMDFSKTEQDTEPSPFGVLKPEINHYVLDLRSCVLFLFSGRSGPCCCGQRTCI